MDHKISRLPARQVTLEEFGRRLIEILPGLMREISRYESNYLTEGRITQPQMVVLAQLSREGPSPMSDLAEFMHLNCSSMTGLVDRLERERLVRRLRTHEDRRVVKVAITDKGEKILKEIFRQKKKGVMSLFSLLSEKERSTYLEILEKLFRTLSESAQSAAAGGE